MDAITDTVRDTRGYMIESAEAYNMGYQFGREVQQRMHYLSGDHG